MKQIAGRSLVPLVASFLFIVQAKAGNISMTFNETVVGTITSGIDTDGIFGPAGASLAGDPITFDLTYTYFPNGAYIQSGSQEIPVNYGLVYEGSGFEDFYGFMHEQITVGSQEESFYGDANAGGASIPNTNADGTPRSSLLSTYIGSPCFGRFSTIASQNSEPACESSLSTDFVLGTTSASILSVAGANTLFSSVTAGSVSIDPYMVPTPAYNQPSSEAFSFTTDPEPATSLLAATSLALLIIRIRRGLCRESL